MRSCHPERRAHRSCRSNCMRSLDFARRAVLGVTAVGLLGIPVAMAQSTVDARAILKDPKNAVFQTPAPPVFKVRFETTKGVFVVEVTREWAPLGVDRFYHFAALGFFDDSRVFRMIPNFVAQFGIPGDTALAWAWSDQTIPDDPVRLSNTRGTLVFATAGPSTRTSQLFINLGNNTRLDQQGFSPVGRVIEGMEVVDSLYAGYGELKGAGPTPGAQDSLFASGNVFLDRVFPKLDKILKATVIVPSPGGW